MGDTSRVLLVHEWLEATGGSENVFEVMRSTWPSATSYCLWNDSRGRFPASVKESPLARSPFRSHKAAALPLMPWMWQRIDLGQAETVVASSHAFAHHAASVAARDGRRGFAYIHTPARYVWARDLDRRGGSLLGSAVAARLRRIDRRGADPLVSYAANSAYVARRIQRSWGVFAQVIHPPVEVDQVRVDVAMGPVHPDEQGLIAGLPQRFVLGASRFVPYKRLDLAIRVGELLDLPVVLAGEGPDLARLRALADSASVPVQFVGRPSRAALACLYAAASLYVFMAVEDFGIMPVESIAVGTPVLVADVGGAAEVVAQTGAGRAVAADDEDAMRVAAAALLAGDVAVSPCVADRFSSARFVKELHAWVSA